MSALPSTERPALTARAACMAIMRDRWRRNFCLPNYTPKGWWECDVFELTAAGYFREYEVKLTWADFKADAAKQRVNRLAGFKLEGDRCVPVETDTKHGLLEQRSPRGPSFFWFVAPAGLLRVDEVPEWAGLIELKDRGGGYPAYWRWGTLQTKPAPRLHRERLPDDATAHARGICYWRMHDLLRANR